MIMELNGSFFLFILDSNMRNTFRTIFVLVVSI